MRWVGDVSMEADEYARLLVELPVPSMAVMDFNYSGLAMYH